MKVIDLLNKIANGEEVPKKIKFEDDVYYLASKNCYRSDITDRIFEEHFVLEDLNDEVEIIEEDKKIEKIDLSEWAEITYIKDWKMLASDFNRNCGLFVDKINEIIDYINKEK